VYYSDLGPQLKNINQRFMPSLQSAGHMTDS
jgi:hypothetical protein